MPENGIVPGLFEPSFETHEPPVVVILSRLTAGKFCDLGIRAFAIVRSRRNARLVVIGDGPVRASLEKLVKELDLSQSVTFLGSVAHDAVAAQLRAADLLCHPSVLDASPTAVLEGMASGKPVVCADVGGHADWVTPDVGKAVRARSPDSFVSTLADALLELIDSPRRRVEMGHVAVAKIKSRFEWPAKIDAMLSIYSSVLHQRKQPLGVRSVASW